MHPRIVQASVVLQRVKDRYINKMREIDGMLQSAVSQDPANLTDAQAVQDTYATGIAGTALAELTQPS